MMSNSVILPGGTIGLLGSGQLGRMTAVAARRLGYRVVVYSPDADTPAGQVADVEIQAAYDDLDALAQFSAQVDVVTYEFENVPAITVATLERRLPVRPGPLALETAQDRVLEKTRLQRLGLPVTPFQPLIEPADLSAATIPPVGGILKTARFGYDGKGQQALGPHDDLAAVWQQFRQVPCVLETRITFEAEVSMIGVRGIDGEIALYGPILNDHRRHILDVSRFPTELPARTLQAAAEITRTVLQELSVVGVLCVEFFVTAAGDLLINELAPRPHNSGHLTIEACVTSQFEQQVRAVCGLPLGCAELIRPAAMVNLLGDVWAGGTPHWSAVLELPWTWLHLYGKVEPRAGRKMGHITALANTSAEAAAHALTARERLLGGKTSDQRCAAAELNDTPHERLRPQGST